MQNIIEILPQNIVIALGWSLLHSVWQSILLVTIFQFFLYYHKGNSLKYKTGISLIFMQLVISIITYSYVFEPTPTNNTPINNKQLIENFIITATSSNTEINIFSRLNSWFGTNINLIVLLWFLGIAIYLVRFIINIYQIKQLKTNGLYEIGAEIKAIFEKLILKMDISQKVNLFESVNVTSPLLIGHLKPFILLPIGLQQLFQFQKLRLFWHMNWLI